MMKIFISMKVPRGDAELEKQAALTADLIQQAEYDPFIATHEIAKRGLTDPKEFIPFVRQHIETSNLMIVLYHPELRGGLIEMGIAYAHHIPIWLCHKPGEKVSSSAHGCADLLIENSNLENFKKQLSVNLCQFSEN